METPILYSYVWAMAGAIVVVLVALGAYFHHARQASSYRVLESKLPDACRLADLEMQVQDLEIQRDDLKDELREAHLIVDDADRKRAWLEENEGEIASLQAEREQQERVRAELQTLQSEQAQLREQRETSLLEAQKAKFEREQAVQQFNAIEKQRDEVKQEYEQLKDECEKIHQERQQLKLELTQIHNDVTKTQSEADQTRKRLEDLNKEVKETKDQLQQVQIERGKIDAEVEALKSQRDAIEQSIKSFEESLMAYKEAQKEWEKLYQEREQLKLELIQIHNDLAKAQSELDQARKQLEDLNKEIKEAKGQLQQAQVERGKVRADVEILESQRDAMERSIKSLEESFKAFQEAQKSALKQLEAVSGRSSESSQAGLWDPILLPAQDDHNQPHEEELKALEYLSMYLEDELGLQFPRRTLWAFHTSLKIAEMSPLVVLAGISGTGKSELPRCYAEAMGIHFLNMAVQPRWDSPQDMFGFFNYLESRYRPTELTRALIQMDRSGSIKGRGWNAPKGWKKKHSRSDEMLLVLLDEMNLARVEYYFSEFLSRLETRRGLPRDSYEQLRKAEIALEVGRHGHEDAIMRLFVDTNVLFVGTMNEDETTQTLSDKVVDRANFLCFGKPKQLQSRETGTGERSQ